MSEAINMHKRLAMGEKLTGQKLKNGGRPMPKQEERRVPQPTP
jgi:hypothetical protein